MPNFRPSVLALVRMDQAVLFLARRMPNATRRYLWRSCACASLHLSELHRPSSDAIPLILELQIAHYSFGRDTVASRIVPLLRERVVDDLRRSHYKKLRASPRDRQQTLKGPPRGEPSVAHRWATKPLAQGPKHRPSILGAAGR